MNSARSTTTPAAALASLALLAGCSTFSGLPASVGGPQAQSEVEAATAEMCAGPGPGEVQAMAERADAEAQRNEGLSYIEQRLASGLPVDAANKLADALVLLDEGGDPMEAERLLLEAMAVEEAELAPLAPARLASASQLANLYIDQDRFADALPLERFIVAVNAAEHGPFYEATVDHAIRVAVLERELGQDQASAERFGCARTAAAALWGEDSPIIQKLDSAYARLLED